MKLLNDTKDDLSPEFMLQEAVALEMIYAAEIVFERFCDVLRQYQARGTLFQEKKLALKKARIAADTCLKQLEIAFDNTFTDVMLGTKAKDKTASVASRSDALLWQANDLLRLAFIYYGRSNEDADTRKRMQKALLNFKANPDIDLKGILEYYNFDY